jgi:putative ABC transport system substrate-binding protein
VRRRDVVASVAAALAASSQSWAQPAHPMRRLGILATVAEGDPEWQSEAGALLQGLERYGWRRGANLQVEYRFGAGQPERLSDGARHLVSANPDVLLARSTIAVRALGAETRTIPIVFVSVADPVGEGFGASLARPGGSITGFTQVEPTMGGKWLELLREIEPRVRRAGVLFNPQVAVAGGVLFLQPVEVAAASLGMAVTSIPVRTVGEIEDAVAPFSREAGAALVVPPDVFVVAHRASIIATAARHHLPAVYAFRNMAVEGGLVSYGVNVVDLYRRSAAYVDRIFRGERPGELPIQSPTTFELVINLKTARALGLEVSRELLLRADEVIE